MSNQETTVEINRDWVFKAAQSGIKNIEVHRENAYNKLIKLIALPSRKVFFGLITLKEIDENEAKAIIRKCNATDFYSDEKSDLYREAFYRGSHALNLFRKIVIVEKVVSQSGDTKGMLSLPLSDIEHLWDWTNK